MVWLMETLTDLFGFNICFSLNVQQDSDLTWILVVVYALILEQKRRVFSSWTSIFQEERTALCFSFPKGWRVTDKNHERFDALEV